MNKVTVEIASYPKSGNTWLRFLVREYLKSMGIDAGGLPADIHQKPENVKNRPFFKVKDKEYSFYKSHLTNHPEVSPDKILYIYRHPLDVLISSLNFKFIKGDKTAFKRKSLKKVEDILADGEMGFYFHRFKSDLGKSLFSNFLGKYSNYDTHTSIVGSPNVIALKYEDLLIGREPYFFSKIATLFEFNSALDTGMSMSTVDDQTLNTNDPFFWKGRSGTYREYLSDTMIASFEKKHHQLLKRLDYL
jgi:hypothetical protein